MKEKTQKKISSIILSIIAPFPYVPAVMGIDLFLGIFLWVCGFVFIYNVVFRCGEWE